MSDTPVPRYYLAREIEKAKARHQPIPVVIPAVDGGDTGPSYPERTVEVAPAQLWSDDLTILLNADPVRGARRLLGPEVYEHWVAAGGTAMILVEIVRDVAGAGSLGE